LQAVYAVSLGGPEGRRYTILFHVLVWNIVDPEHYSSRQKFPQIHSFQNLVLR